MNTIILAILTLSNSFVHCQFRAFTPIFEAKTLDYAYPTPQDRQKAINDRSFIPGNGLPIDTDIQYYSNGSRRTFVTVPRSFYPGVPATLNTITSQNGVQLLSPYPSWSWHQFSGTCNKDRLLSVFRVQKDECNRLWVVDTGNIAGKQLCPPQILAFDLNTDKVVHSYEIPASQITPQSLLVTPIVDIRDPKCLDAFVYIADVTGYAIIVYNAARKTSWKIVNRFLYPVPMDGRFSIAGKVFYLMDGILGMSLTPYVVNEDRRLIFHPLASRYENYVPTSVLRNESLFKSNMEAAPEEFKVSFEQKPSQSAAMASDKYGNFYFGLLEDLSIVCWNYKTNYSPANYALLERNAVTLRFPSGMKVITSPTGTPELWVLTCRFEEFATQTMDQKNQVNFRILQAKLDQVVNLPICNNFYYT